MKGNEMRNAKGEAETGEGREIIIENRINEDQILSLINKRLIAKKEKDYAEADKIRNSLKEKGVELIDQSPELTTWVRI